MKNKYRCGNCIFRDRCGTCSQTGQYVKETTNAKECWSYRNTITLKCQDEYSDQDYYLEYEDED